MNKREYAKKLMDDGMRCFCDLDTWEPERSTGHSWVCPIHKKAIKFVESTKIGDERFRLSS